MGMKFDLDLKICSLEKYNAEIVLRASVLCPGLNKHKCNDSDCGNIYSILVAKINRNVFIKMWWSFGQGEWGCGIPLVTCDACMSDIHHLIMMMMMTVCGPACDVSDPSHDPQVGHVLSYASPMPLWHYHIHVPPEPIKPLFPPSLSSSLSDEASS